MTDIKENKFSDFVYTLPENVIKKVIWDQYYEMKTELVPKLESDGSAWFGTICLLKQFAVIKQMPEIARKCEHAICLALKLMPVNDWKRHITGFLEKSIFYSDYLDAVKFIRKTYGKWLSEMEFSDGIKDFPYEETYDKFKVDVDLEINRTDDYIISKSVEKFFCDLDKSINEQYEDFESYSYEQLYEAYSQLKKIPCKSVLIRRLEDDIEKKIEVEKVCVWRGKLDKFKTIIAEKEMSNGRIICGDNVEKTKLAEKEFVNSGKFEYILFINDTSRKLDCSEGIAITTDRLYYKKKMGSGDIPVDEISHFEIAGTFFAQGLAAVTFDGKKTMLPYNVEKTESYKYLTILETLLRIIKSIPVSE